MATDADIPVPVCEARGEQVGNFVDNIIKITVSQLSLEKQTQDDKHNELPTVEGENFSKSPSIVEVRCEENNNSHDVSKVIEEPDQTAKEGLDTLLHSTKLSDQPVELDAKEETCMEESQQNGEDGDRGVVPEQCSTHSSIVTPEMDNATGVAQLSKDTSSNHLDTDDSFTENIAHTKEILQENSLLIEEGEELNVELKTTANKSADEKPTEEGTSSNLTDKVTSEQEALDNERSIEDNFNTAAGKVSHENSTSGESIITLETSNSNELQSMSDLNSLLSKEEETTVQKGVVTDHSGPELAEKSEESSLVQVEDSQIERDEHVEEESERLPLTEVSMVGSNDNVPAAMDDVKDKDEDLKAAELSANEQSTRCTSAKEDMQIENPAESLHVAPENIDVPDLSQENSTEGLPEEQSRSVTLHGNTIEAQEATTDADDRQKESLESFQPIVSSSHEEGSINEVLQEATSDHTNGKIIDEDNKHNEVLEDLSSGEVHYDVSKSTENLDQTIKDGTDTLLLSPKLAEQPEEFAANEETSAEEIQQNVEESDSTDKDVVPEQCSKDSSVVTTEIDDAQVDNARVVTQLSNDTNNDHHGSNDSSTKHVVLTEEILKETDLSSEEIESHAPCISEGEELNVQVKTTDDKSVDQKPTEEDMLCNLTNETSEQEGLENKRSVEDNFNTAAEEVSNEKSTSGETITALETSNNDELQIKSDLNSPISKEEETNVHEVERSVITSEDYEVPLENTLSESHGDVECQSKTLEDAATDHSNPNLAEKSEESSIAPVEDSQNKCDETLEEESEMRPVTEVSTGGTNDNVRAATDNVKDEDEVHEEAELSEIEQSTRCTSTKEDMQVENPALSLHVAPENVEVPNLNQESSKEGPPEEQSRNVTLHENTIEAEEATTNADDRQKESLESFLPIVSSLHEEGSLDEVLQEATSDHMNEKIIDENDKHKEVLENLSSGEAHCENTDQIMKDGTDTLPLEPKLVDQPIEFAANEQTYVEEIQQNAEEFDSTEKDVVPVQCSKDSEIDDPEMDDAKVVTQLSKDTSSDQHGSNVSSIENFVLTEKILQETDLSSKETESHAPCISEGEKLNVQLKTTDNKSADEKPTEEYMSCNLTNEVSKEGESDQNEMTSEHEGVENERSVEEKFNTVADEATHEKSTSGETIIALESSNNDELQSKSGLNSPLSKEEETTVQEGERSVTTSEDYGVPSENTLSESHGDVEYQSTTLEDAPTDHSDPKLTEKSEESSIVQVEDSQIECDEHLEEESERLPQTEVSTGGTNDNVPAATDIVKDEDEESEQSTRCTLVKEDVEIENPAESLQVALENIEVSNLSQENIIKVLPEEQNTKATLLGYTIEAEEATIDAADSQKDDHESFPPIVSASLEEGNMNAVLQEITSDHTDEKIIDEVEQHEEVIENRSTTVSTEDTEGNSLSKLDHSENIRGDESVKDCEPLPLDLAREVSDVSTFSHEAQSKEEEPKTAELCDNERGIENTEDENVNSEDTKAPDLVDKISGGTVDATEEKEETPEVQNVPTIVPNEKMEENSLIQVDDQKTENEEHLNKENEQVSSIKDYTGNANNDEGIVKDGGKIEDENPSGTELFVNDRNTESGLLTEKVESEKPVESLHVVHEDVKTSDFGQHTEETGILDEQIPAEKSVGIPSDETEETTIDEANTNEKTQELQNVLNEDNDKDLSIEVDASEIKHDTNLEEEPERPSLIEASKEECQSKVELPNDEKSTECITRSLEEQNLAENSQTIISDKTTGAAEEKEPALENVATETTHEHIEENSVTQVDCAEREQEEHLGKNNQNSSLTEAPEETDATESKNIDELKNRGADSIKPELENEENTESTSMNEETDLEKPIDSLQVKPEDIQQHDSSPDINNSIEEQISNTDSPKISIDNAERETVDASHTNEESVEIKDVAKDTADCEKEDSIQIEEVGSQNPLNEALAENDNDDESTKITESSLIKEEESLESLQVEAQDIETPPLSQDRETSSPCEQSPIANTEGIMDDNKDEIAESATGVECESPKDKNIADTTLYEDTEENLQVQEEDCSQLEENKGMGNESENIPSTEAPAVPSTEEEKVETPIDEQIPTSDPQETCNEAQEKNVDAANVNNDVVISVPNGDNEDNSPIEMDGLQKPSSDGILAEKINDDEPITAHEAKFINENAVKANLCEDEEKDGSALVKEESRIESLQVADEDTKDTSSGQDREASHLEEQASTTDSCGTMGDQKDAKTLDLTDLKEETLEDKKYATTPSEDTKEDTLLEQKENSEKDSESTSLADAPKDDITESTLVREVAQAEDPIEVIKEMESFDIKAATKEEEGYLEGVQMTSETLEESFDGSASVPTSETLEETDPRRCTETEVQVPNGEKEAKITEQVAENDQKNIKETQPSYASEDVSESRELNGEEETALNSCKEISSSPVSEASEETRETREEVETEDQKQESTLQVSELVHDSSVEKIEKDAYLSLVSANDSGITEEMQKLKDVPLPAPEEKIIETTDCKESDVVEGATNDECIDHQEQDDTTRSFPYDKNTEKEQETVANVILPASFSEIPGVDHSPTETELTNREEPCTGKTATGDDEEKSDKGNEDDRETCEKNMSGISSAAPDMTEERDTDVSKLTDNFSTTTDSTDGLVINENTSVEGILANKSSVTDLETKNDGEALEIKEATPSLAECQDAESVSIEGTSNFAGSLTEEKSDSNEVAITPGENKSGYESNNQGLESIAQVQSCDIISKTEEENLKEEAEIQFDKAVTEDILQEETTYEKDIIKDEIWSEKEQFPRIKEEDEDIKEYQQDSCEDKVMIDSHQEDKVNQHQKINSKETETVAEVSETDDKAPEDLEEKIVTNEATERIIHQEEQVTSIEEHTTKIDNEKAHELDSACVKTDTQDTNKEGVQIAIIPDKETEEQNKKAEICSSDEVQEKDEEKLMLSEGKSEEEANETYKEACVEAEKLDFASQTKDISECEVSSASEDIALTEKSSEDTIVTAEVQEANAGIDLGGAVPEATGLQRQEVEEFNDKCAEMADTSAPVENLVVSTSKSTLEHTQGAPLEAEVHGMPGELNTKDSEVKMAERDVEELRKESFETSNNENPVEEIPEEKIETSEEQETKPIQNAPVSETLGQEIEGQQRILSEKETVPESSIRQSSVEDTAQHDKREENQQIDSSLFLPHAQCSDIKTSEKDPPVHVGGLGSVDVAELEASPRSLKDKHVVQEADDTRNMNPESLDGDKNISTELSQREHVIVEPSEVEQEEQECRNEEKTDEEMEGKPETEETEKPSLSDLLQVSETTRETSQMSDHSPTEKEPTRHTEDVHAENTYEPEHENSKTDEEKDDEDESQEQGKSDLSSEAPVMVDMGDADVKVTPKKSHNILSGVGSKVKHSIAKVKKAITGKSSQPKTPSPKKASI